MSNNPLAAFFRTPKVQQSLPTGGRFFSKAPETSINGELAIYPMTAPDEIVLKNPDALLNGDALERLFKSCVPGIHDAREISVPDMDVLLLAIKLASFGDKLEVNVACPKCHNEFIAETSIRGLLDHTMPVKQEDSIVRVNDDVIINIKPYDFKAKTILDLKTFEESKSYDYLVSTDISDLEKQSKFNEAFERIAELNLDLLAGCVTSVVVPSPKGKDHEPLVVTDTNYILAFIRNQARDVPSMISEKLKSLSQSGVPKELEVVCAKEECQHEWTNGLVFDAAHFFG